MNKVCNFFSKTYRHNFPKINIFHSEEICQYFMISLFISELVNTQSTKQKQYSSQTSDHGGDLGDVSESTDTMDEASQEDVSQNSGNMDIRDDLINPFWIEDQELGQGEVDNLSGTEITFWKFTTSYFYYHVLLGSTLLLL